MSIKNDPGQIYVGGIIGAIVSFGLSIFVLYSKTGICSSSERLCKCINCLGDQRTVIRTFLLIFTVCHFLFYIGLTIYAQDPPPLFFQGCYLIGFWAIYVSFVMLCALWVKEVSHSPKVKKWVHHARDIWICVYSVLNSVFIVQTSFMGIHIRDAIWDTLYSVLFLASFICFALLCIAFLIIICSLRKRARVKGSTRVSYKMYCIIVVVFFSFLFRLLAIISNYVCHISLDNCIAFPPLSWYIFAYILPNTGFLMVTFYLTHDQDTYDSKVTPLLSRDTNSGGHTITNEILAGNALYDVSYLSDVSRTSYSIKKNSITQ